MDKSVILILMSAEIKVYLTAASSFIAGLLISHGVADPSQASSLVTPINTIFGDLLDIGAAFYTLETLLVKHKAEVANKDTTTVSSTTLVTAPTELATPVTPVVNG